MIDPTRLIRTSIGRAFAFCFLAFALIQPTVVYGESTMRKLVRYESGGEAVYGLVEGDRVFAISGNVFGDWSKTESSVPLDTIKILAPSAPSKVIALAGNYADHLGDIPVPEHPEPFLKQPTCVIAHGEEIVIPPGTEDVHPELELVVVIGKTAKDVSEAEALDHVLGITCGNDVSARDWQRDDRQWWRAKGSDTFGPCGPYIASGFDYADCDIELRVNGEVRQKSNTSMMIFKIPEIVSFISRHVTLEPGDQIYTGTPGKTRAIASGDVIELEIENVGVLRNTVAE